MEGNPRRSLSLVPPSPLHGRLRGIPEPGKGTALGGASASPSRQRRQPLPSYFPPPRRRSLSVCSALPCPAVPCRARRQLRGGRAGHPAPQPGTSSGVRVAGAVSLRRRWRSGSVPVTLVAVVACHLASAFISSLPSGALGTFTRDVTQPPDQRQSSGRPATLAATAPAAQRRGSGLIARRLGVPVCEESDCHRAPQAGRGAARPGRPAPALAAPAPGTDQTWAGPPRSQGRGCAAPRTACAGVARPRSGSPLGA